MTKKKWSDWILDCIDPNFESIQNSDQLVPVYYLGILIDRFGQD